MDDQRFDNSIKNKVGEYEDPGFDPSALAALHHQMASVIALPWYALYRTELLTGSALTICTLVIIWSQWFMGKKTNELINQKVVELSNQQNQIDKLQNEISGLRNAAPDTIRIIEIRERPSDDYYSLLYRIKLLETSVKDRNTSSASDSVSKEASLNQNSVSLSPMAREVELYGQNNFLFSSRLIPKGGEKESLRAVPDRVSIMTNAESVPLSIKTLRDLEKHYQKGVGIRLGPTIELSKGFYKEGESRLDVTWGLVADFIISPSVSIETGAKYAHRLYEVTDKNRLSHNWPGADESLGSIETIDVDSWVFEIPVNVKYRYPFSLKTHGLTSVGYSSLIFGTQQLEYEYSLAGNPGATISSSYRQSRIKVYSGTFNIMVGVSNKLKTKKILETSIYYQQALDRIGIDRSKPGFFGVRGAYWFTLR